MEHEYTKNRLLINNLPPTLTHCNDCDEESVCNCENNEQITPYYSDTQPKEAPAADMRAQKKHGSAKKTAIYRTAKSYAKKLGNLAHHLRASKGKLYIKQTTTTSTRIYRNPSDTEPIESFETHSEKSCSLQALVLVGIGALALSSLASFAFKKRFR